MAYQRVDGGSGSAANIAADWLKINMSRRPFRIVVGTVIAGGVLIFLSLSTSTRSAVSWRSNPHVSELSSQSTFEGGLKGEDLLTLLQEYREDFTEIRGIDDRGFLDEDDERNWYGQRRKEGRTEFDWPYTKRMFVL
jgi:hypothetical protein